MVSPDCKLQVAAAAGNKKYTKDFLDKIDGKGKKENSDPHVWGKVCGYLLDEKTTEAARRKVEEKYGKKALKSFEKEYEAAKKEASGGIVTYIDLFPPSSEKKRLIPLPTEKAPGGKNLALARWDFSSGIASRTGKAGMVRVMGTTHKEAGDMSCIQFDHPGYSQSILEFTVSERNKEKGRIGNYKILIDHCGSFRPYLPYGGIPQVKVTLNGHLLINRLPVYFCDFVKTRTLPERDHEQTEISLPSQLLLPGKNELTISLGKSSSTLYWLKTVAIEPDRAPEESRRF